MLAMQYRFTLPADYAPLSAPFDHTAPRVDSQT
ncbi:hypothetical protein AB868_02016 [Serratia marcescens]|uniref:Uncharacterized protein n=1 Tax=Serratia marcescens TaxID=615 RepID=A0A656VHH5_SERMA|nr:hypothetical protein AB868_02016 [Serratia marcescens]CAI1586702.1 Uncharacterised protein [Serratia marcescens]